MKKKDHHAAWMLPIVLFIGIFGAGYYFFLQPRLFPNRVSSPSVVADKMFGWEFPIAKFPFTGTRFQLAYSDIRDPGGIPQGLPVRLKIPQIGVDSAIEDALITPDGRMDVPAGSVNVAWFSLGPHPGQAGSAVIGGHYGITKGVPFVFYNLDKLNIGDKVYILDDKNDTLAFVVRRIESFDRNADATTVFTSQDGLAHLNLITCEGIWNQVNGSYPKRLVVFTDAIPSEGAITITPGVPKPPVVVAAPRTLSLGSRGADVVTLQDLLVNKGFLIIPRGIKKGYFGFLTRAAVRSYQTSVGLRSTGVYDASTRTNLLLVSSPSPTHPALPPTALSAPEPTTTSALAIQNFFATPIDAFITSLLLLSILWVVYKILK